jgi:hypothetical protein
MRKLRRALQLAKMEDDDGVRKYHAIIGLEEQKRLWAEMYELNPEEMRGSLQSRSSGTYGRVKQIDRDKNYFDKNVNPGDPIEISFNYDQRLADDKHSTEYEDRPPDEDADASPEGDEKS